MSTSVLGSAAMTIQRGFALRHQQRRQHNPRDHVLGQPLAAVGRHHLHPRLKPNTATTPP